MENMVKEPVFKYQYLSPDKYQASERKAMEKHERPIGVLITKTGASLKHPAILSNLTASMGPFLKDKSCIVFSGRPCRMRYFIQ